MFMWKKQGRIFNPRDINDRSWLQEFAQAPCVLKFDDYIRVYFSCRPPADIQGQYVSYSAFVDLDNNDLKKILRVSDSPILSLGETGMFDEFGTYPVSVVRYEKEVRAYYAGWTRCESVPFNVAIGMATSRDDGATFQKVGPGPIISYSPDEPFIMSGPKIRYFDNRWFLYYIAGKKWIVADGRAEPVYRIRLATSADGINWKKHNQDLIECRIESNECQASPDVIYVDGKYHMFFCYRYSAGYRGKDKGYRIGYASSNDGITWQREDSKAGIDVSEEGWDSEMISYPHVFDLNGKLHMFYLGNAVGREGFGMATLEGKI